ncbi:NAD(P)-binding protein [Rhizodiscina lignyota]|uniref:NAD(P)-binding protein n=1 Tax=Rhizodiscina lignyota TaxID=1504668 RepID=A0A9P4M8B9_9PEZI|nr:NAD(P)-binding protein [Rhizodiscina lignyota]
MPAFAWNTPQWHYKAEDIAHHHADRIKGRTVLITGVAQGSLGQCFCTSIAPYSPKTLILAGRSPEKLELCQKELHSIAPDVSTRVLHLDLGDFDQVRKAADEVNGWDDVPVIDVLVNNAGLSDGSGLKIIDGIEQHFRINHLGHFLFTNLIMAKVVKAAEQNGEARIVNVSSRGHVISDIRWDDLTLEKLDPWNFMPCYGQSKTANILFSVSLAEKLASKNVQAFSLHPGSAWTGLITRLPTEELMARGWADKDRNPTDSEKMHWKTMSQGTSTHVTAAFDPSISEHSGSYLQDNQIETEDVKPYALDKNSAERLWKLSEELVRQRFNI